RVPDYDEEPLVVGVPRTHDDKSPTSPPPSPPARLWQARTMNELMPSAPAASTTPAPGGAPTAPAVSAALREHFAPLLHGPPLERGWSALRTLDAGGGTASMRAAGNTQPAGLLHGGATSALAESFASFAAILQARGGHADGAQAVGTPVPALHHRPARSGSV